MFEEVKRLITYYKNYMPYKSAIILSREKAHEKGINKFGMTATVSVLILAGSIAFALPVQALLKSNTVSLTDNRLIVACVIPPTGGGGNTNSSCQSNDNVHSSIVTNQTATTGTANNSNNTTSGSAVSGNASNSTSSNISVAISGC